MKKHLTEKQINTIKRRQKDYLMSNESGLVIAHYGDVVEIETQAGKIIQCSLRQNLPPIVVGDTVAFEISSQDQNQASLLAPGVRQSQFWRRSQQGQIKLIAANVDQVFIVMAPEPNRSEEVLDRYLVMTALQSLKSIIIFNKIDLLSGQALQSKKAYYDYYEKLLFPVLFLKSDETESQALLSAYLKNKNSVFVGLSGVGKSSLIKSLLPEASLKVGNLSISGSRTVGTHTTSNARLYHLPCGGNVIDSPGVREFAMQNLTQSEIEQGFVEFRPYLQHCKEGKISRQRLESYGRILRGI